MNPIESIDARILKSLIENKKIILFDGVCNLCNSSINWIIDKDTEKIFSFASLQSKFAKNIVNEKKYSLYENHNWVLLNEEHKKIFEELYSVILIEDEKIYLRSEAILRIANHLKGFSTLTKVGSAIPNSISDYLYSFIAKNRYNWFGKMEVCRIPNVELQNRFIE